MPPVTLTAAQIALQAERKALKQAKKAAAQAQNGNAASNASAEDLDRGKFLRREWLAVRRRHREAESAAAAGGSKVGTGEDGGSRQVRIVTWNILAQTLVRRELFPGSDCLRWGDRKAMLQCELASYSTADIICLQECDRLSDLAPSLSSHTALSTKGRGKLHGLVVFYRTSRFSFRALKTVYLDEEEISNTEREGEENVGVGSRRRRGGTRQTKNVALIVGLQDGDSGIVIATTHLFWHPKFAYERTRQIIILARAIRRFQKENHCEHWPAVLAGDLNTQPSEATYQLLSSPHTPLSQSLIDEVNASRLVHTSVDNILSPATSESASSSETPPATAPGTASGTGVNTPDNEKENEDELPDKDERSIANTRDPIPSDGLFSIDELVHHAQEVFGSGARSAYGTSMSEEVSPESYTSRGGKVAIGGGEPAYTCYTPLFKLTLDYLFILPSVHVPTHPESDLDVQVTHLLRPGQTAELGEGLPRKGISASDHVAVGCGLAW